jgi:pantothenate kinase type III
MNNTVANIQSGMIYGQADATDQDVGRWRWKAT